MFQKMKDIMSKKKQNSTVEEPEVQDNVDETLENIENEELESDAVASETGDESELGQQYNELKDKYMRMLAEFENFKKRTRKEKLEFMSVAAKDTMTAILPILDDFDRAKKNADDDSTTEVFTEGVELVYNKLSSVLSQKGLKAMESNGETFDPEFHEALTEIPAPNDDMKGKIIDTIEKGYFLNDKIIRYAKVVVGK